MHPGELICRHVRYPRDWMWPAFLTTRHRLQPNRRQYFFVSACKGANMATRVLIGCGSRLDEAVRIESCTRVDLSDWNKLPVSMVFAR